MKQFDYKVVSIDDFNIKYRKVLETYGKEGWELITVLPEGSTSKLYYFKKEISTGKDLFNNDSFDEGI